MKRAVRWGLMAASLALAWSVAAVGLDLRGSRPLDDTPPPVTDAALVARGAYLARAGNCMACHTARGGVEYAGGRGIETPFGTVHAPNLTPDADTGLGSWTPAHFRRAMGEGRSRDGRLLSPAFPYPHFTHVTRDDNDALFAFLRSLPPVHAPNRPNTLQFPFDTQLALAVWRALYFRAGEPAPEPGRSAEWHRGRYLVDGLGHCAACHTSRDALGGPGADGGLIPMENWYAPPLGGGDPASVVALLKTGVSPHGTAMGPMAEVVFRSTAHLTAADVAAMASYLKDLPVAPSPDPAEPADARVLDRGAKLYETHCADCHGADGRGAAPAFPPLAGNPSVARGPATNVIQSISRGGFAPVTAAHPQPYGMPPFAGVLDDAELAAVATYVRQSWGNEGGAVSALDVLRTR